MTPTRTRLVVGLALIALPALMIGAFFRIGSDDVPPPVTAESDLKTATYRVATLEATGAQDVSGDQAFCGRAEFTSAEDAPKAGQSFHDGDVLRIPIRYYAAGCKHLRGIIFGYFPPNTPWHDYYAKDGATNLPGSMPVESVTLAADSGRLYLTALPGPIPPRDLASPPNLEGFVFCGAVLTFDAGEPTELDPNQQLDAGCEEPSFGSTYPLDGTRSH